MSAELWYCPTHGFATHEPGWTYDPDSGELLPVCPVDGCDELFEVFEFSSTVPRCPVTAEAIEELRDRLEEAMATSEPVAMVTAAVSMANRMAEQWAVLSRALSDEALFSDPDTMGEAAHAELMELGSRGAACELAGRAAGAIAGTIARQIGMHVENHWPES